MHIVGGRGNGKPEISQDLTKTSGEIVDLFDSLDVGIVEFVLFSPSRFAKTLL
jgi:hypothetical protein